MDAMFQVIGGAVFYGAVVGVTFGVIHAIARFVVVRWLKG